MSKRSKRPGLSAKSRAKLKRASIVTLALLAFGLLMYAQIVRPDQLASSYTVRLNSASDQLESCFSDLTATSKLKIFGAPDIPLQAKRQDLKAIHQAVEQCESQLKQFNVDSQTLQGLRLSGYTAGYRAAVINQNQALAVVGESSDVLSQYKRLASFLDEYFASLEAFVDYTEQLNQTGNNTSTLYSQGYQLAEQGKSLHQQAARVRALNPSAGFEGIIQPTAAMLDEAANGFDNLGAGYARGNDNLINTGFKQIESAQATYSGSVINLPFEQLQNSYTIKQVAALPNKIVNLRQSQQLGRIQE